METRHIKTKIFSIALLILMLLATGFAYEYISKNVEKEGRTNFENQSRALANAINIRFNRDTYLLYSLRGLYNASKSVEKSEFKAFGDGSELKKNFPGIYAIEFVEKVSASDKDSFIESVRSDTSLKSEGYPEFKIFPEENKDNYLVLKYFYPEEKAASFLGFDFSTDENRNAAMEEALKKDQPVITKRAQIIGSEETVFVIFLPIYKNGLPTSTESERRENLSGFVGVVIEVDNFFDSITSSEKIDWQDLDLYIYDQAPDSQIEYNNFLYDFDKESAQDNKSEKSFFYDLPLNISDETWTLHFVADKNYGINGMDFAMTLILLLFGIIFSFFLSGSFYFLGTSRSRALILAEEMTQDLRDSEERFRSITEAAKDAIVMMDDEGKIALWNKAAEGMFGYKSEEIIGQELHKIIPFEEMHKNKKDRLNVFRETGESSVLGKNLELPVKNKNGEIFQIELTVARTKLKEKWHAVGIMRDITERKKIEDVLKEKMDDLERFNRLAVGREIKMTELKKEINELKKQKDV